MNTEDLIRSVNVVIDDARELHGKDVLRNNKSDLGHTAITEAGEDIECLTCGHINEAEYEIAVFASAHNIAFR